MAASEGGGFADTGAWRVALESTALRGCRLRGVGRRGHAAYAAAIVAFAYALVSLYWAVGGRGLVGTVGGFVEQMARRGGAAVVLLALVAVAAKAVGGLIALALVRPWGRVVRHRLMLIVSAAAARCSSCTAV